MDSANLLLRKHIDVLWQAIDENNPKKPRGGKTERAKAVTSIYEALSKKTTIDSLSLASKLELLGGISDNDSTNELLNIPLGWAELFFVVLNAVDYANKEGLVSKTSSKVGSLNIKAEYMNCLRKIIKYALKSGPRGCIRPLMSDFLFFSHNWLQEPALRIVQGDQIWQCVRDMLEDDENRAMLTPPFIRSWVEVCFDQITGRGPLACRSQMVTNLATDVLKLIVKRVGTYDVLTQSTAGCTPAKMLGGDFGYVIVCERCCMMLTLAESMPRREARDVQSVAFQTLSKALPDHSLDVIGSSGLHKIIQISIKPLLSCWSDRRSREAALGLGTILLRLAPEHSELVPALRGRVLNDLSCNSTSATWKNGTDISQDLIDIAASCISFQESLKFCRAPSFPTGLVTAWIRVTHAIISLQVPTRNMYMPSTTHESFHRYNEVIETVIHVLKQPHNNKKQYSDMMGYISKLIISVATSASRIHSKKNFSDSLLTPWQSLYVFLRDLLVKADRPVLKQMSNSGPSDTTLVTHSHLLRTISFLSSLPIINVKTVITSLGSSPSQNSMIPYPFRLLTEPLSLLSNNELQYCQILSSRSGEHCLGGFSNKLVFLDSLISTCETNSRSNSDSASRVLHASSISAAICRGSCPLPKASMFDPNNNNLPEIFSINPSKALHEFYSYTGLSTSCSRIITNGSQLVRSIRDQQDISTREDPTEWHSDPLIPHPLHDESYPAVNSVDINHGGSSTNNEAIEDMEKILVKRVESFLRSVRRIQQSEDMILTSDDEKADVMDEGSKGKNRSEFETQSITIRFSLFIASYLHICVNFGLLSTASFNDENQNLPIFRLLICLKQLLRRVSQMSRDVIVHHLEDISIATKVCATLCLTLSVYRDGTNLTSSGQECVLQTYQFLSTEVTTICKNLCNVLADGHIRESKKTIDVIEKYAMKSRSGFTTGSDARITHKRSRSSSRIGLQRKRQRRQDKSSFVSISSEDDSIDVQEVEDDRHNDVDDELSDSDKSDSTNENGTQSAGVTFSRSALSTRNNVSYSNRIIGAVLTHCVKALPHLSDEVVETLVQSHDKIERTERKLSTDGIGRSAMISGHTDPTGLERQKVIWDILVSIEDFPSLIAIGKSLGLSGRRWESFEKVSQQYVIFHAGASLRGKRKQYPLCTDLERWRIMFLEYAHLMYLKLDQLIHGSEHKSFAFEEVVEIVKETISVTEIFRKKHAFRMPCKARISYLKFLTIAIALIETLTQINNKLEKPLPLEPLGETKRAMENAFRKFLSDSESFVRMGAAFLLPKLFSAKSEITITKLEEMIEEALPSPEICQDRNLSTNGNDNAPGSTEVLIDSHDSQYSDLKLTDREQETFVRIHECFRSLGGRSKSYSTLIALQQLSVQFHDLLPFSFTEILVRCREDLSILPFVYHIIAQLSLQLGQISPAMMYISHSRLLLPYYFARSDAVEKLHKLPVAIVVDEDHYRDGLVYDWIRDNQSKLIPFILVQEDSNLNDLSSLADNLGTEISTLIEQNIVSFATLFPMQFVAWQHEKGKGLWKAIDDLVNGKSFAILSRKKDEVVAALLRSISVQPKLTKEVSQRAGNSTPFWRDSTGLRPPQYDPLVIAKAINHLHSRDSKGELPLSKRHVQGSLFAQMVQSDQDETGTNSFPGFVQEICNSNRALVNTLLSICRFFDGPPSPQPRRNNVDAFFCVGTIWKMIGKHVLSRTRIERVLFYNLIAKGFEYDETASDAAWLLSEVQKHVLFLHEEFPNLLEYEIAMEANDPGTRTIGISTKQEKYVLELLRVITPKLTAEITHTTCSGQKGRSLVCSRALFQLLKLCADQNLWKCLFINGPFPRQKQFQNFCKFFETSKELVCVSSDNVADIVIQSIKRLSEGEDIQNVTQTATLVFANIQELNQCLSATNLKALRDELLQQTWGKSVGREQLLVQFVQSAISSLLDITRHVFSISQDSDPGSLNSSVDLNSAIIHGEDAWHYYAGIVIQEISQCLSSLFLIHPHVSFCTTISITSSYPSTISQISGVDLNSRIKLSLRLLLLELQSQNPLSAQCALRTLTAILRTDQGKLALNNDVEENELTTNHRNRAYRDKRGELEILKAFRSLSKNRDDIQFVRDLCIDPQTGEGIPISSLPHVLEENLWTINSTISETVNPYNKWLRKICTVLASESSFDVVKVLGHVCYSSFQFSASIFPYLLMEVLVSLSEENRTEISTLINEKVLKNPLVPSRILKLFVHALDVLSRIGLHVTTRDGIIKWQRDAGAKNGMIPYYYVLDISYFEAATIALQSGSCFSAIRYAQMYADQKISLAESRLLPRRSSTSRADRRTSSCPSRDGAVLEVEKAALQKIKSLLMSAMKQINEMDGVHAFCYGAGLAEPMVNVASLDGNWEKSLSACEVLHKAQSNIDEVGKTSKIHSTRKTQVDTNKEYLRLHSMIGLGTLNIATDYWEGLRNRILRGGVHPNSENKSLYSSISKLNDLRFCLAWKLEQWEKPALISADVINGDIMDRDTGFHMAVYESLQFVRGGRLTEALKTIAVAQANILKALSSGSHGVLSETMSEAAGQHQILQVLKRTYIQNLSPSRQVQDAEILTCNAVDRAIRRPVSLKLELQSESQVLSSQYLSLEQDLGEKVGGDVGFMDAFRKCDLFDLFSDEYSYKVSCDLHNKNNHAHDLPVIVGRCLNENEEKAIISAVVSEQILRRGGSGAWTHAAISLGSAESSSLTETSNINKTAWKLQEVRLRWVSNEDAQLRKEALRRLNCIIETDLRGEIREKIQEQKRNVGRSRSCIEWHEIDEDQEKVSYLRSRACQMAAEWSMDLRTYEPLDIFEIYLESGLNSTLNTNEHKKLVGESHYAMACFADTQIKSIDSYRKTRKYDEMVRAIRSREDQVLKLASMKKGRSSHSKSRSSRTSRSGGNTQQQIGKDLDNLIRVEKKKAEIDRQRLEKLGELYKHWQLMACKSFAASLREGTEHDLRAAFRMIAVWIDSNAMRDIITLSLTGGRGSKTSWNAINVPLGKLLPLAPQLSSRLNYSEGLSQSSFQLALASTLMKMTGEFPGHCLWQVLALSNSTRVSANKEKFASLYRGDKDKKDAADNILQELKRIHRDKISQMKQIADAYIHLSEIKIAPNQTGRLDIRNRELYRIGKLEHVPVPTVPLPIFGSSSYDTIPYVHHFSEYASICSGLSKPLRVVCVGSDGKQYPQMVKGRDDLRGDAVMEQLFMILNVLLEKETEAVNRNLNVRTYRIIPLSPFSGVMQFVSNTRQMKEILVGRLNPKKAKSTLHERYRPKDITNDEISSVVFKPEMRGNTPDRMRYLATIWQRFLPVFHYFFLENWLDPEEWFNHQRDYSRSVAVMSIVGFILGLGDRHLANILLDVKTGEVVHIDFGIAFEQGKELPTPEKMPFRLSRDIVDGFGIAGVEGIFRKSCEVTLTVMRKHKDVLLTVVEVLLHDPMFNWDLTPEEVLREHNGGNLCRQDDIDKSSSESVIEATVEKVKTDIGGSRDAQRALHKISEKLDGLEGTERLTVGAHVARLIDEAQAFHIIASAYPGWAPWL